MAFRSLTRLSRVGLTATRPRFMPAPTLSTIRYRPISHSKVEEVKRSNEGAKVPPNLVDADTLVERNRRDYALTALATLLILGIGITTWGLIDIYTALTMWPQDIRRDLRVGLRASYKGDFLLSSQYLNQAWQKAKAAGLSDFGHMPTLKTSGIAIILSTAYENDKKPEKAYAVLEDALQHMQTAGRASSVSQTGILNDSNETDGLENLSPPERLRAVAIAYKLGEMAEHLKKPDDEEKYLTYAVNVVLKHIMEHRLVPAAISEMAAGKRVPKSAEEGKEQIMEEQLGLPTWVEKQDLAAPFEALATFYTKENRGDYALPLYLQAISILIPSTPAKSSVEERCRGAQLMGNISDLILSRGATEGNIKQATSWAQKGLDVTTETRKKARERCEVCEVAYAVLSYNVALTRELAGDSDGAKKMFGESLAQSENIGLDQGVKFASGALRKLSNGEGNIKPFFLPEPRTTGI